MSSYSSSTALLGLGLLIHVGLFSVPAEAAAAAIGETPSLTTPLFDLIRSENIEVSAKNIHGSNEMRTALVSICRGSWAARVNRRPLSFTFIFHSTFRLTASPPLYFHPPECGNKTQLPPPSVH